MSTIMANRWTKEEVDLLILFIDQGYTAKEIANELDRTVTNINSKINYSGLSNREAKRLRYQNNYDEYLSEVNITRLDYYKNYLTNILHKCNTCSYEWTGRPGNIMKNNSGCPKCATMGFKYSNPAVLYLVYFKDIDLYKIGVTCNINRRIKEFGIPCEVILLKEFEVGSDAIDLEKQWLKNIKTFKHNTGLLKSGNTETFKFN